MARVFQVYLDTPTLSMQAGELVVAEPGGPLMVPKFQFVYTREYLNHKRAFALSPDLPLITDVFWSLSHDREMLGAFADTLPDRWGRRLIERRTGQGWLPELEYLLGVPDFTRQGALRISNDEGQSYLGTNYAYGGAEGLRAIQSAVQRFEAGTATASEVEQLLLTGSQSNGGQFPKTALVDTAGDLCIAKFCGSSQLASPEWEAVCLDLARTAGIEVPEFSLLWLDESPVLIEKRFDRAGGKRLPYMSAETFLLLPSNPRFITPYTTFAEELHRKIGPAEAHKLFDRVAFLLLVNNVDDHWKNHGLLYTGKQWQLAPLFDVNPTTLLDPYELPQLTKSYERKRSLATLLASAASYGLKEAAARERIQHLIQVVATWRTVAERYVRSEQALEQRAPAFMVQQELPSNPAYERKTQTHLHIF